MAQAQYGLRNKVSKIFIISLKLIRCTGKETFKFSRPYSEIRPAKLTNHCTYYLRDIIKCNSVAQQSFLSNGCQKFLCYNVGENC